MFLRMEYVSILIENGKVTNANAPGKLLVGKTLDEVHQFVAERNGTMERRSLGGWQTCADWSGDVCAACESGSKDPYELSGWIVGVDWILKRSSVA